MPTSSERGLLPLGTEGPALLALLMVNAASASLRIAETPAYSLVRLDSAWS